ncbi:MAG: uncharacterized protein JWO40_538 [Candidatus Doudnabacteria bacterium]|nr:uncharacterized protein [Candidatus Doudnabacteria bacterium]
MTNHILNFREVDKKTFELIRDGVKKVETRAGSKEYLLIQAEDTITFVCGSENVTKKVIKANRFKSFTELFNWYRPWDINPDIMRGPTSESEMIDVYRSFPGYPERIMEFGILAFKLENIN